MARRKSDVTRGRALSSLSKLSVWRLRLGIAIERIKPGHPQQNGRHERIHLTLKKEATRAPGMNSLQQQASFDDFVREFNDERPHEALAMKRPAEVYTPSSRPYRGLPELTNPLHDRGAAVTACGRPCLHRSARGCHPCLRYVLSPMSPGWTRLCWRPGRDSNP